MTHARLPAGARYVPELFSGEEAARLIEALDTRPWDTTLKRRVQHFGYRYDYRARAVSGDAYLGPLPDWLAGVCLRLVGEGYFERLPDQVIANEYLPGQGISAHVDCVPCFADRIASLSLLSACEMVFRPAAGGEHCGLTLEPGSLLVMEGAARYDWTHEIPARTADIVDGTKRFHGRRVSLTFRNVIRSF